jgi:hypothetical protein
MSLMCSTSFRTRILGRESFDDIIGGGCIRIFAGTQPANADDPEQGTLLGVAALSGQTWVPGTTTAGIRWSQVGSWVQPTPGSLIAIAAIANGTAGWFRIIGNGADAGMSSLDLPRIDGSIGTPDAPAQMTWTDRGLLGGRIYPFASLLFALPPLTTS